MSADKVTQLVNMGFERSQATQALVACNDVLESAILQLCGEDATPATESTTALGYDTVDITNPNDIPDLSQYTHRKQETGTLVHYPVNNSIIPQEEHMASSEILDTELNSRSKSDLLTPGIPPQSLNTASMHNFEHLTDPSYSVTPPERESNQYLYNVYQSETSALDTPERFFLGDDVRSPVALANGRFLEGYLVPLLSILGQLKAFDKAIFDLQLPEYDLVYNPDWFRRKSDIVKIAPETSDIDPRTIKYVVLLQILLAYLQSGVSKRAFARGNFITENIPTELRQSLATIDEVQELLLSFYRNLDDCYQAIANLTKSATLTPFYESEIDGQEKPVKVPNITIDSDAFNDSGTIQQWLNKAFVADGQTHKFSYVSPILSFSITRDGEDSFVSQDTQIEEYLYPQLYSANYFEVIEQMRQEREQIARERLLQNQELLGLTSFEGFKVSKLMSRTIDAIEDLDAKNDLIKIQEALRLEKSTLSHQLMSGGSKYASLDVQDFDNVMAYLKQNEIDLPPKYILAGIIITPVEFYVRETHSADSWRYVKELQTNAGTLKDYVLDEGINFESILRTIRENLTEYLMENPVILIYVEEGMLFGDDEFTVPEKIKQFFKEDNDILAKQKAEQLSHKEVMVVEVSDEAEDSNEATSDIIELGLVDGESKPVADVGHAESTDLAASSNEIHELHYDVNDSYTDETNLLGEISDSKNTSYTSAKSPEIT